MRNGVPLLMVDGKAEVPMVVWTRRNETLSGTVPLMKSRGFRIHSSIFDIPWPQEGERYDFSKVDAEMAALLKNDPQALYMPRIWIEPPLWWKETHPEEMPVWENGKSDQYISVTSERWLAELGPHIDALVTYMETRWDKHIFAYHPAALNSHEWYYASTIWESNDWGLRNYEPSFARGFRNWLRKRYQTVARLNSAWGTRYGDFAAIPIPDPGRRRRTSHGLLRDPAAERAVVDFTLYQSVAITDAIKIVARRFKDACQWRKLVYVFYGYTFELAGLQEGISQFGHLDLDSMLNDPSVDVYCAPIGYNDRRNGGSGPIMAPAESCNARGRAWCNEDDTRTHLSVPDIGGWGRVETEEQTVWAQRRNFMASLVRRSYIWFMDQGGGWFEGEAIWQNLAKLREVYAEIVADPSPLQGDVAVVVDEASLCQVAYGIELGLPLLYDIRAELNRMGTTPELWLQADYLRGRGTPKKLVIFLNAFSLTQNDIVTIRSRLRREGSTALWFYAPGVLDPSVAPGGKGYDPGRIEQLTGIRVAERAGDCAPAMRCRPGHRLGNGLAPDKIIAPDDVVHNWQKRDEKFQFRQMTYPPRERLSPLFKVADDAADVFGEYADSGEPAMATKQVDGVTSVFVGGLTLPPRMFANIAADAGVHLYCDAGDVIYTDGRFLSLTACSPGEKLVRLPAICRVTDVFTGAQVTDGRQFAVSLCLGETRVYRLCYR